MPGFSCNYHRKDFFAKKEMNLKIMIVQSYYVPRLIDRDHSRLTNIRAGLREGTPLHEVTLDLVEFEHFVVSLTVMGAVYLIAVVILIIEIFVHNIKEKNHEKKEMLRRRKTMRTMIQIRPGKKMKLKQLKYQNSTQFIILKKNGRKFIKQVSQMLSRKKASEMLHLSNSKNSILF